MTARITAGLGAHRTIAAAGAQPAPAADGPTADAAPLPPCVGHAVVNLPNIITFTRLCAVPVTVWLVLRAQFVAAFWLFVAAGVSDAVDGWLARRRGPTPVGMALDPVADKLLMVSMYVTLVAMHRLADWLAILVVFREIVILGGILVLAVTGHKVAIRPLLVSKLNTVLQILLVAVTLALAATGWHWPTVMQGLVWAVAASTLISGSAYVWAGARVR